MRECRYKKRIQIYLDGWMDDKEARRLEAHLKRCSDCQTEMVELEEIASAALEIVDQAPDINYWKNFPARVLNRIISRDVNPYGGKPKPARSLRLKIGSYSVAVTALAAAVLLIFNYVNRSHVIPDAGIQNEVEISEPIAADDTAEPKIPVGVGSEAPPVVVEAESMLDGQRGVPVEEEQLITLE
jgi:anti-sigma factor RsiW